MNGLLISSVLFGLCSVAMRGAGMVAPAATRRFISHTTRLRGLAALIGALGVWMSLSARHVEGTFASIAHIVGIAVGVTMVAVMLAPDPLIRLLGRVPVGFIRARGVAGFVAGVAWVIASFVYF